MNRLSHAAAEMADLREAVKELRGSVNALVANVDPAQEKILKTNLRDARASAALRVQQLSTSTTLSVVRIAVNRCAIHNQAYRQSMLTLSDIA